MNWHSLSTVEVLARLDSPPDGLTSSEAEARRARYGPNALSLAGPTPAWKILAAQLRSVIVLLLVAAAAIAFSSGDAADGIAIVVVLAINVALGFSTELRGRRAMEALRSLVVPRARVVRSGVVRDIDARELVPGDVIVVTTGASMPADARLIDSVELAVMEATLTGESVPVSKRADVVLPDDTSLPERTNLVFQGTSAVAGRARAVVVATGMETELGRIGKLAGAIGEERTPLERRLDVLGRRLAAAALSIAAVIALAELLKGTPLALVLQTGIAVAVAAVPEGLPVVVTIAMAMGVHRMARRRALVRRLPSVETLGSTTVICTDKTGTLTSGEMEVTALWVGGEEWTLDERGRFVRAHGDPTVAGCLTSALRVAALANRASEPSDDQGVAPRDNPEEIALIVAAKRAGITRDLLESQFPEVAELPFSSARMLMATFHRSSDGLVAFVKGAPGRVLDRCERVLTTDGERPLDAETRDMLRARNAEMARRGLRVLALAQGPVSSAEELSLKGLTFVGFAGMIDPPAPGVRETIVRLREAGIRILMLTGDQLPTAEAVARELGLLEQPAAGSGLVLPGADIDRLSDEELTARVERLAVCSRASPEAKLRIVTALQRRGEVVAMLGDGVNDAAALKKANVGVAMGRRGTDAAREAAGVILADDRFETIAVAVEEGRAIFDNIRRFVFYLFSCNLGELAVLLAAGVAGLPLPLLPLHLLWLNLVTDTFPALALAFEPAEANAMRNPPRDPRAQIMSRPFAMATVRFGLLIGGVTLVAFVWGLRRFPDEPAVATTLSFMTLGVAQLLHLGNARSREAVISPARAVANRFALGAVLLGLALQITAVAVAPLARALDLVPLPLRAWGVVAVLAALPAVVGQVAKLGRKGSAAPTKARA